jgi:hypothetical protein
MIRMKKTNSLGMVRAKSGAARPVRRRNTKPTPGMKKGGSKKSHLVIWLLLNMAILGMLAVMCFHYSALIIPLCMEFANALWHVKTAAIELVLSMFTARLHHRATESPSS